VYGWGEGTPVPGGAQDAALTPDPLSRFPGEGEPGAARASVPRFGAAPVPPEAKGLGLIQISRLKAG